MGCRSILYRRGGRLQDTYEVCGRSQDIEWSMWEVAEYCMKSVVDRVTMYGVGGRSRDNVWSRW